MIASPVLYAFWAVLLLAAAQDLWKLRISNLFPIALVVLFVGWHAYTGFSFALWQNLAVFAFVLSAGVVLFAIRWFGGGDVKLFAAAALWFDLARAPAFLMCVTIGGAVLALLFIAVRHLLPADFGEKTGWAALRRRGPIPYGMAIAGGTILCSALNGIA